MRQRLTCEPDHRAELKEKRPKEQNLARMSPRKRFFGDPKAVEVTTCLEFRRDTVREMEQGGGIKTYRAQGNSETVFCGRSPREGFSPLFVPPSAFCGSHAATAKAYPFRKDICAKFFPSSREGSWKGCSHEVLWRQLCRCCTTLMLGMSEAPNYACLSWQSASLPLDAKELRELLSPRPTLHQSEHQQRRISDARVQEITHACACVDCPARVFIRLSCICRVSLLGSSCTLRN